MARTLYKRVNFFDGQQLSENDLDTEQAAWRGTISNAVDFLAASGVEKEYLTQRVLFDSDDLPASIEDLMDGYGTFDGEPIYEEDSLGLTVFNQPSDSVYGNYLEIELTGTSLTVGSVETKVYIFGKTFGGGFIQEVLTFRKNESQVTKNYFTTIVALMTQNFRGNSNDTVDGNRCTSVGGRMRILEAQSMFVCRDVIMAEQSEEPNMDYRNFKTAVSTESLDDLLNEIAESYDLDADDLRINKTATTTRELPPSVSGLIVAEKFLATTNNIQKVSVLLSVKEDTTALAGHEYDFSGSVVVGIRKLQKTTQCISEIIPGSAIEYDPEPSALVEVSFDQDSLQDIGITLTSEPKIVDFVFTHSILANPALDPKIEVGSYYAITISRSGNISTGTIVLQEAENTDAGSSSDTMRVSVFSNNKWTDVVDSDLWFKVYTNAIRITNGSAVDSGVQITSPKTKNNSNTGIEESFSDNSYSLVSIGSSTYNYVVVQGSNSFSDSIPHPATGNLVSTRISDVPDVAVVSESSATTIIDSGNNLIVLGAVRDTNPVGNDTISGTTIYPGLVRPTTFTILAPDSDLLLSNVVGSILVPNTANEDNKYRIVKQEVFEDAYGDVNGDGVIDLNDIVKCQLLEGYSKDFNSGSLAGAIQQAAIVDGKVSIEEIIRADVTANGYIDIYDAQAIQRSVYYGEAFDAGGTFKRVVLTVEDLVNNPLVSPNMVSADSAFNAYPYSAVSYRIDPVDVWDPENVEITDLRRFVPKTFTSITTDNIESVDDKSGGSNSLLIPGDLVVEGSIFDQNGDVYPVDLEVNTIVIDLPEGTTNGEIDIFNNYIKDSMVFYDNSYVRVGALENSQVKVSASIQSFVKDLDGYDFESVDGYSAIDENVAIMYTQTSGILRVRAANIRNIDTRPELRTKIVLTVYLKKAGFKNQEVRVSASSFSSLLTPL